MCDPPISCGDNFSASEWAGDAGDMRVRLEIRLHLAEQRREMRALFTYPSRQYRGTEPINEFRLDDNRLPAMIWKRHEQNIVRCAP